MTNFTFKREERLKSAKAIGRMFQEGQSFGMYPLRLVWLKTEGPPGGFPVQFALSVPKKNFKSAVARNRIRRKVREAWRLNKHRLYEKVETGSGQWAFMVLYTAKEDLPFVQIEDVMKAVIRRFIKKNLPPAANPAGADQPLC